MCGVATCTTRRFGQRRCVKLAAQNLESAVAGTQLLVVRPDDDLEALKAEVMEDMQDIFASVDRSGKPCNFFAGHLKSKAIACGAASLLHVG